MFAFQGNLDAHILVPLIGEKMIDDREIRNRLPLPVRTDALIYCRQVVKRPERLIDFRFQVPEDIA
jgi:hypothetical protein